MASSIRTALASALIFSLTVAACDGDGGSDDGLGGGGNSSGGASTGGAATGGAATGGSSTGGGSTGGEGGGANGADEWLGATPHADLAGQIAGKDLVIAPSAEDAANLGVLYCERNYVVPDAEDEATYGDGELQKVELKFNFFFEDVEAEFQLELEREDLPSEVGSTFEIDEDADVAVAIGLSDVSETEYEDVAVDGTVTLELFEGEADETGLIVPDRTGVYGAYVDVELESGGFLRGSFTANCGDNDIETAE